ncbi:MAG: hypothetical protein MK041_08685 [Aquabacterium sp.]|nr:hypothetical protein [Aquabacterium sp.]
MAMVVLLFLASYGWDSRGEPREGLPPTYNSFTQVQPAGSVIECSIPTLPKCALCANADKDQENRTLSTLMRYPCRSRAGFTPDV